MKALLRRIKSLARAFIRVLSNITAWLQIAPVVLRDGGVRSINIAHVNYDQLLAGKRILITGGSSGIGLAIASKALGMGAIVLITGRDINKLDSARKALNNTNLRVMVWDVGDTRITSESLASALRHLDGHLDILINNAGVLSQKMFPNVTESDWDRVYRINSKGLFFLTQDVCKFWHQTSATANVRKIINISSQGGFVGATYPYRMTKWDIAGLTQGLGVKLAPKNIIVNGIAPGIITTGMQENYLKQGENAYCGLNPAQRVASAEEIAELAAFLMSDASNFIVAQTIVCDGGFSLK